ncbi:serine/threonine-protein kinase/endoribonuclease Ire1p [[Candida] railenensis]|uniref:non-specific serine/threonine protein kinase n=1 Tax=[Candida] railenensis TaxID=45579 RepID=A0A9P0VZ27_9ASCO|nr:serine/threonine-protein kinase/endoribonuclease Ire1p [[Candida] railenensis]
MNLSWLILLLTTINLAYTIASPKIERINEVENTNDRNKPKLNQQQSAHHNQDDRSKLLPLDLRSISDWKLTDLLLISDIDGNLHGIERNTGTLLWTLPIDDPLVKISTNNSEPGSEYSSTSNILWFVEPYDEGSLYYFTPKFGLNQLPTSIKNLVLESPFSLSGDDKIYTGSRKTSLYTINIRTGEVTSSFGSGGEQVCPVPNIYKQGPPKHGIDIENEHDNQEDEDDEEQDTIMIGKTTYELSIHSKENTNIVWNVTYSQWGPNNIDNDLIVQNQQSIDKLYFTPFHDKSLLGINKDLGTPVWISRLPSLAVNVFDVFESTKRHTDSSSSFVCLPHPLKVLNDLQLSQEETNVNEDMVFINKTAGSNEWFAMSYQNYPTLIKSAPVSAFQSFLTKEGSRMPNSGGDYLKNLQVSGNLENQKEVENLINGIHKVFKLNPENFYQPKSRWDDNEAITRANHQIEGRKGKHSASRTRSDEIAIVSGDSDLITTEVPKIMDGIWFPNAQLEPGNNLLLLDGDISSSSISTNRPPIPAPQFYEVEEDTTTVKSLNLIKRICEDIIVILVLLVLLMSFGRLSKFAKNFANIILGREKSKVDVDEVTEKEEQKDKDIISGEKAYKSDQSEGTNVKSISIDETSEESSNNDLSTSKKVTIAIPGSEPVDPQDPTLLGDDDGHDPLSKKKRKRGARGGKRGGKSTKKSSNGVEGDEQDMDVEQPHIINTTSLIKAVPANIPVKRLQIENNLILSDKVLGYGSHGTVVFQGTFENRPVAIKRMLLDFFDIASHEVRLLQESDDHPNVIRYFCSQSSESEKFLYIAIELCLCSLEDIVEKPTTIKIPCKTDQGKPVVNEMLLQLASGLHYLHSLKIVHRDLKPQNILVGDAATKNKKIKLKESESNGESASEIRLLISDFGLCKKLDADQSSFRATTQHAASGTSGWRAPELLLHHDLLEISPETVGSIHSTNGGTNHSVTSNTNGGDKGGKRLTKAIDIFSLGCVYFYILTRGSHPFGDRYLREGNIIKGEYDISLLKSACPFDWVEVTHLISSMIAYNPRQRPDTSEIMKHPFFWSSHKKLEFLLKVSDRFEIERRDPPSDLLLKLECASEKVCNLDWHSKMDEEFLTNLGKYRKYHTTKLMDLLRALRNKYHHYNDMPPSLQEQMSPLPHGFYNYFNSRFPNILMEIYSIVEENLKEEHIFQEYY